MSARSLTFTLIVAAYREISVRHWTGSIKEYLRTLNSELTSLEWTSARASTMELSDEILE